MIRRGTQSSAGISRHSPMNFSVPRWAEDAGPTCHVLLMATTVTPNMDRPLTHPQETTPEARAAHPLVRPLSADVARKFATPCNRLTQ